MIQPKGWLAFERKYPSIALRMNKEQLLAAALMSSFTKTVSVS